MVIEDVRTQEANDCIKQQLSAFVYSLRMAPPDEAKSINTLLPRDVLAHIASLVEQNSSTGSLASFIEVCQEWSCIGRRATKRLVIRVEQFHGTLVETHLRHVLALFPYAENLRFRFDWTAKLEPAITFKQIADSLDLRDVHIRHLEFKFYWPVYDNYLVLPRTIDRWGKLETFIISGNVQLDEFPMEVESWGNLKSLRLSDCPALPPGIEQWTCLQRVDLEIQKVEELPKATGKWLELKELRLGQCVCLKSLPEDVQAWTKLEKLTLSLGIIVTLPSAVGAWVNLRKVSFSECGLQALPDAVGGWTNLEEAEFTHLQMVELPAFVRNWKSLRSVRFSSCWSLTKLPAEVRGWTRSHYQGLR